MQNNKMQSWNSSAFKKIFLNEKDNYAIKFCAADF